MTNIIEKSLRAFVIAALVAPTIGTGMVTVEGLAFDSAAYAQQQNPNGRPSAGRGTPTASSSTSSGRWEDEPERERRVPPCPPDLQTLTAAPIGDENCVPWTVPPLAASEDECECRIVNHNGQASWDCYVLLPTQKVHYCENRRVVR